MSSSKVDERIVQMEFDNKRFEQNIEQTMNSLQNLEKALQLDDSAKGFDNLRTASAGINFDSLIDSVSAIEQRFSAMGIVGMRVLENITDSVMNLGKRLFSFVSEGIVGGGISRALNLEQARFQLQGLLQDEQKVAAVMQNVNDSVTGTAYRLDSAANVASQYAASGIEAGEGMYTALRAVAGVAAQTNSEYEDIGRVFTTVAGNGRLMGDQLRQLSVRGLNAAATLSKYYTELGDGAEVTEAQVREMVTKGQVSFEDFADAMDSAFGEHAKKANESFSGSMANIKASLAKIGADFVSPLVAQNGPLVNFFNAIREKVNEAKDNMGPLSDMFVEAATSMAEGATRVVSGLDLTKPFEAFYNFLDGTKSIFRGIQSFIKPVTTAFAEIFPPITIDRVLQFSERFKEVLSTFKLSEQSSTNLKNTFKGLFSIVDILRQAFVALTPVISPILSILSTLGRIVLTVTGTIGQFLTRINEFVRSTGVFNNIVSIIVSGLTIASDSIKIFVDRVKERFSEFPGFELFHNLLERIQERLGSFGELFKGAGSVIGSAFSFMADSISNSNFLGGMQALWNGVKTITGGILSAIGGFVTKVIEMLGSGDFSGVFDLINTISFAGIAAGISSFFKSFGSAFDGAKGFLKSATGILNGVRKSLEAYQQNLKAGTLLMIAGAIGILAASLVVISSIDSEKLAASLGAVTVLFADLMGSMAVFNKIGGSTAKVMKASVAMIAMSTAISILAGAMKKVADLDWDGVAKGIVSIGALSAMLVLTSKAMSGTVTAKMITTATGLIIFAGAIKILAGVARSFAEISWEGIAKGLVGVGVLLAEVALFLNFANFSGKAILTATGMVILAAAIKVLASAAKDFATMGWEDLAKGLAAITAILAEVALFANVTGNAKHVVSSGVALIAIGAAMKIFASAVKDFSSLSWEGLAKGLTGMAGALTAVTVALNFMPKNMIGIGTGLVIVGSSLLIIASAVRKMGGLSWEEIARGLTVLAGSMTILAVSLNFMRGTLGGSAALLVAATALAILTPVLSVLGAMKWESIAKGLATLAGAFLILGVAGAVLKPLTLTIIGLSAAFALFGVGIVVIGAGLLAVGAGLSAIAIGFGALATSVAGGATAIVAALTVIVAGVAGMIPLVIGKIGEGIVAFVEAIGNGAGAIGNAIKAVVLTLIDVLVELVPAIADGALALLVGVTKALVDHAPELIDNLLVFVIEVLDGLAKRLPELIGSAVNVLMSFFEGAVTALQNIDTETLVKGVLAIGFITAILTALSFVASLVPGALIGVLGFGLVVAELALVLAAVGQLTKIPGLMDAIGSGGNLLEQIGVVIGQFIGGIVGGVAKGVTGQMPEIADDLSLFMNNLQPFIAGAASIDAKAMDGVKSLAQVILMLTASSILDGLTSWFTGGTSLTDFGKELAAFGPYFKQYYQSVKGMDADVIEASGNAARALGEMAGSLPNQGGVVGWFVGENSLSVFAEELAAFGPVLMEYAESVRGLDGDVVTNSVNAAKSIGEMANNLPNQGGVLGWFAGENSLSIFAEEMLAFGPAFKAYAQSVKGMDTNVVTNTSNAAKSLSELANNLPNQGGVASWFAGDNTLSGFGENLLSFGESFKAYADSVKGVDTAHLSAVIVEFRKLADLANTISDTDANGLSTFGYSLRSIGMESIDGFISAFDDSESKIKNAGKGLIDKLIDGFKDREKAAVKQVENILEAILKAIKKTKSDFKDVGIEIIAKFNEGIESKKSGAIETFTSLIAEVISVIRSKHSDFVQIGGYLVDGLALGIKNNVNRAAEQARLLARAASDAAKDELQEASPSKVAYEIGDFFGQGFVSALAAYKLRAENAGASIGMATQNGLASAMSSIDTDPVIRPVLDLSDVESGASTMGALLDGSSSMLRIGGLSGIFSGTDNGQYDLLRAVDKLGNQIEKMPVGGNISVGGVSVTDDTAVGRAVNDLVHALRIERRM